MKRWVDAWPSPTDWSKACPICQGRQVYIERVPPTFDRSFGIGVFDNGRDKRCPCWQIYYAAQKCWDVGFPRGYLNYFYDPGYPINSVHPELEKAFLEAFPKADAWTMSEADAADVMRFLDSVEAQQHGLSLCVYGEKGVGKTAFATAIAAEMVKRYGLDFTGWRNSWVPAYVTSDTIFASISNRQGRNVDHFLDVDFLVIDDVRLSQSGFIGDEFVERLHNLLQWRSANNLCTVLTANKIGQNADSAPNAISAFLGLTGNVPNAYGKYRFIKLTNVPLRPLSPWNQP